MDRLWILCPITRLVYHRLTYHTSLWTVRGSRRKHANSTQGEQIQTNSFCAARQWFQQFLSASWNIACLTYNNFLCGIKLQRYGRANINRLSEGRCRMRVKLINNRLMFLVGSNKRQEDEINIKLQLRECLTTVINMLIHGLDDFL